MFPFSSLSILPPPLLFTGDLTNLFPGTENIHFKINFIIVPQMSQDSLCNSAWLHNSPVLGLALGILTTALFQSSSATTSLAP